MKINKTLISRTYRSSEWNFGGQVTRLSQRKKVKSDQKNIVLRRDDSAYRKNSCTSVPIFMPGQKIWVIVGTDDGYGRRVIEDQIEEVHCFSVGGKSLKQYWLRKSHHYTGIEAHNIYTSKRSAEFFKHH